MMKILIGYNGTRVAKAALALARKYAKVFDAKVLVVTSMEGGIGEKVEKIAAAEEGLRFAKAFMSEDGVEDCETHQLARGLSPGEDIVHFARDHEVDMILVGVEKKSRTQKLILGSTAQYIILKGPCPVTTVK